MGVVQLDVLICLLYARSAMESGMFAYTAMYFHILIV